MNISELKMHYAASGSLKYNRDMVAERRASGRTTRIAIKAVMSALNNAGTNVIISDHHERGNTGLYRLMCGILSGMNLMEHSAISYNNREVTLMIEPVHEIDPAIVAKVLEA